MSSKFDLNEYVKSEEDSEKYQNIANSVYESIDIGLFSSGGKDQTIKDEITNKTYTVDQIGNDLFGDSRDGHITMSVDDAIDQYYDIIIKCLKNVDFEGKTLVNRTNLKITCEYVRAFGM